MFERDVDRLPDSTHLRSMPSLWPSVEPQPDLQHAGHLHQRPPDSHHRDATTERAGCCAPFMGCQQCVVVVERKVNESQPALGF